MNSCIRVRVLLDTTPILFPKQCWLLFDSSACRVVGDIAHLISERFGINGTSGLQVTSNKLRQQLACAKHAYHSAPLVALSRWFPTAYERRCSNCQRQRPHPVRTCTSVARISIYVCVFDFTLLLRVKVVGYQRSTIPALTSVASPSVSTAVDGTEAHKEKHKKRKRESKDSGTERGGAPDEHGRCSLHSEANEGPSTEALPSGTKRKRKSQSSRGSSTSEAKEANVCVTNCGDF